MGWASVASRDLPQNITNSGKCTTKIVSREAGTVLAKAAILRLPPPLSRSKNNGRQRLRGFGRAIPLLREPHLPCRAAMDRRTLDRGAGVLSGRQICAVLGHSERPHHALRRDRH